MEEDVASDFLAVYGHVCVGTCARGDEMLWRVYLCSASLSAPSAASTTGESLFTDPKS